MEEYRKIVDFENYEISNFGDVRNVKTVRILKPCVNSSGYYVVNLCEDKKQTTKQIHQLVADAFIENPENKQCVDHQDNNPLNNCVENLRWVTLSQNSQNAKISKRNKSGFKGVCFNKNANKWQAQIMIDGIHIHLGYYENIEDAKSARIKRANDVFGIYTNSCEKIE
jgi:hypothetical protein